MNFKTFAAAGCAATAILAIAGQASAQTPPVAQTNAPPPVTHGAAIPGVCIMSIPGAIAGSTVGKYVDTRMQQIIQQVNGELNGERTAIENENKTLQTQAATLDRTTAEQRGAALQVRVNALQRKAQQREREVQATEQKAVGRVGQEMEPLIRQVYQQRQCSVLLNRDAIVLGNPAMDITPAVVTALNAKITQFTFDRERLDQQQPAAAAPAQTTTPQRR
ncbi:OmpH family outer membrane protein [Phenylobacterium sp. VNQ135]|uniref:OmpH family outer membrane protein n=1 Tax=Phenylobacterium sp. VNQ135 TaxID=3400922 RepID=UPI003BFAB598